MGPLVAALAFLNATLRNEAISMHSTRRKYSIQSTSLARTLHGCIIRSKSHLISLIWQSRSPASNEGECSDRKSTRLNSSHQIISYAVFCLKKKTAAPSLTCCLSSLEAHR